MVTDTYEFADTDDNEFTDWDCVWSDWTFTEAEVIKTIFQIMALKYSLVPMRSKYIFEPL